MIRYRFMVCFYVFVSCWKFVASLPGLEPGSPATRFRWRFSQPLRLRDELELEASDQAGTSVTIQPLRNPMMLYATITASAELIRRPVAPKSPISITIANKTARSPMKV